MQNSSQSNREIKTSIASRPSALRRLARRNAHLTSVAKSKLKDSVRSLQHRNYQLFFYGQLVSLTGGWMQNVAQSWLVYELTHSSFWLGFVGFISSVPMLLFSAVGGMAADKFQKRDIVLICQTAAMVLAFILAVLVWTNSASVLLVCILAFCLGVVNAFDVPARQSFVVEMVGREDMPNAIALNSATFNVARLVGPAVGGIAIAAIGTAWCFFLNGVSFIAVIAGLLAMVLVPTEKRESFGKSAIEDFKEAARYIYHHREISRIMVVVIAVSIFGWSYAVLMPMFADDVLKLGATGLGRLMSANGIGALMSAMFLAIAAKPSGESTQVKGESSRMTPQNLMVAGVALASLSAIGFSVSHTEALSMVLVAGVGAGLILFYVTANTYLQHHVPDALRGRVMGIYTLLFGGLTPIGSLQTGAIAHAFGPAVSVSVGAGICLTVCLSVHAMSKRSSKL
jgi:MFS family permease